MDEQEHEDEKSKRETALLVAALSAVIAAGVGWYFAPFGTPLESAALLACIAIISFAARGYLTNKK